MKFHMRMFVNQLPEGVFLLGAVALGILVLVSCASQPVEAQLATACNGVADGYVTAAGYRHAGKLTPAQIKTLTDLEPLALASCDKANPPKDLNAALTNANAWLQQWARIQAGVPK